MPEHLKALVSKLAGQRILVIGDVILDEYVTGVATRLSREAAVPILEYQGKRMVPGGAANPAANIVALASQVIQVGIIGNDQPAQDLKGVLSSRGIEVAHLISCSNRPTTVKSRIMAQMGLRFPQQVARIDTLSREPVAPEVERRLLTLVSQHIQSVDAVLLSDYHIGLLSPTLIQAVKELANEQRVLLAVDTQGRLNQYHGFDLVKCNADDAATYLRRALIDDDAFGNAASELLLSLQLNGAMVITRGKDGATLASREGVTHLPVPEVSDVFDTVGAGDTSIAVLTLAVAAGISYVDAVLLANYASGIVVQHVGNYTPSPDEIRQVIEADVNERKQSAAKKGKD